MGAGEGGIQRDYGEYGRSGEGVLFAMVGRAARCVRREYRSGEADQGVVISSELVVDGRVRWTRHPRTVYLFITCSATHILYITDMSSPVKLYVYDLSNGMVRAMSMQVVGRQIDGIW